LSNNRFILGAGIGYKPDEFENTGWNFKTRAKRSEECLEILRLALTGKEIYLRRGTLQDTALYGGSGPQSW
jgi:alkanesulfonate monooxygenase SsuD/methylene tetrahydromethanopterin reductase-like flavin-dependent oxidoreductase (luciferase family)